MSKNNFLDFSKPEDVKEVQRLIFEDDKSSVYIKEEYIYESDLDDQLETISVDSNTDHENTDNEDVKPEINDNYFIDSDDRVETRLVDSNINHENIDNEDIKSEVNDNYFIGKDGTKWYKKTPKIPNTRPFNILTNSTGGVGQDAKNAKNEFECWNLFFSNNILNLLIQHTNNYMENIQKKFERERDCHPTNIAEIKSFLALLYLAGVFRGGHQQLTDFWNTEGLGLNIFRMVMSERRFRFIMRCLRFDDNDTRKMRRTIDKLAEIREFFTIFIENCQKNYHLGQNVTIDEMLLVFRGECSFKQYIPVKPSKYGIKIFCLSDSKLYYTSNMEIDCGQQPEGPYRVSNSTESIVMRLSEPIFESGRNITADSRFTSLNLVRELAKKKLSYVGTIQKNSKELPELFVSPKNRSCFSSIFGYTENETLVSYVPQKGKTIVLLSNMHLSSTKVSNELERKPEIISFYNDNKSGVDVVDKLCATYTVRRSTRRWPIVIFYRLLNVAELNARIIFSANKNKFIPRRDYLKALALNLVEEQLKIRAQMLTLPEEIKSMLVHLKTEQEPEPEPETYTNTRKKRRCQPCLRYDKKSRLSVYRCEKCGISLCLRKHSKILCESCIEAEN